VQKIIEMRTIRTLGRRLLQEEDKLKRKRNKR